MKRFIVGLILLLACLVNISPTPSHASQSKAVRIAAFNFYPAIFQGSDGSVQGFYADFLKEIARREGWTIEYVYGSWADGLARIQRGEVDLLTNVAYTEERAAFLDYAKTPLLTVWAELYVPKGSPIANLRQVRGKRIGVMKGDFNGAAFRARTDKLEISCQYVEFANFEEVFKAAANGTIDGGVVNNTFGAAKQQVYGLRSADIILNPFDIYFAVRKGKNRTLLETLDRYLADWRKDASSPFHIARKRWGHGSAATIEVTPPWLRRAAVTFATFVAIGTAFILILRVQVRRKTAELAAEVADHRRTAGELKQTAERLVEELAERKTAQEALQAQTAVLEMEIAERERTEYALRESEESFRTLFDTSNESIFIHEPVSGEILSVNRTMCQMYGVTPEKALGLSVGDLSSGTPPYTNDGALSYFRSASAGEPQVFEWHARTLGGDLFWAEVRMRKIVLGGKDRIMATVRDVSERKQNDRRMATIYNISQFPLNTEQEFLDFVLDELLALTESQIGYIYLYDEKKELFILNSWSREVMEECLVQDVRTEYHLENTGLWGEAVRQRSPIVVNDFQAENPLKKGLPAGHVPLLRYLSIPVLSEGTIYAVVGVANKASQYTESDVLQLKIVMDSVWKAVARSRVVQEHLKLEQQLLHAQKLESLGVLAGGIAHDFNNILLAIIGNAELALMRISRESPATDNLRRIEQAAARATDLARQMLAYSGKGKFVLEHIGLNDLLTEMLHMLEVSISKKAVLRLNTFRDLPTVEGDATQLRQVVMNLVINASEAIGDRSGIIAITTGCMDCNREYLRDVWLDENLAEGLYVYLEVADTGCGMTRETMARIFDPFFTTKFTGRGLGMAAVLGIVRGHKGALKVYSEPEKGTTFKVLLAASNKPAELFAKETESDGWQGTGTVLLVDDEETVRGIGKEMLAELGFDVVTACDGREALEVFKSTPAVSLVLLDLTMPHLDGEQCYRELRRLDPELKIIMSSGFNEQEVAQRFLGKGVAGFIQKPYRLATLRDAIKVTSRA